jgi:polyhydroxyalkanoate synthesis repressor PhaR
VETAKRVFKKYGKNRRLYDTAASRYVNLEEVAALIRQGTEVQIVDAQSGEDLTRFTLMQIITEDAKEKTTGLPLELLRQLIVASDQAGREFFMWYLSSAFDTYRKLQGAFENGLAEVQSAASSPFQRMKSLLQSTISEPSTNGEADKGKADDKEVRQLRRRAADLETRLRKSARTPKRRNKAPQRAAVDGKLR